MTDDYTPSKANGPDGPRNDEKQLRDIASNTANFKNNGSIEPVKEHVENEDAEEPAGVDPFDADNVGSFILIQQMRNYDALMALLNHFDHDAATRLSQLHESGQVITGFPELA